MALGNMNINGGDYIPMNLESVSAPPPSDSEEVVSASAAGYHKRPLSVLWSWIKGKIASDIITIQKTLTITTEWQDTGITKGDLETGTYVIQFSTELDICGIWNDKFSGIMSWDSGFTNSTNADDIPLHSAGHARNGNMFYLRTTRQTNDGTGKGVKLQIKATSNASRASTCVFRFRKLI